MSEYPWIDDASLHYYPTHYVHTVLRIKTCAAHNTQIALSDSALLRFHSTYRGKLIPDSLKNQLNDSLATWTPFKSTFF